MTGLEQQLVEAVLAVHFHEEWMKEQPWHGNPVNPPDRIAANRKHRELEYKLKDAIHELVDARNNKEK